MTKSNVRIKWARNVASRSNIWAERKTRLLNAPYTSKIQGDRASELTLYNERLGNPTPFQNSRIGELLLQCSRPSDSSNNIDRFVVASSFQFIVFFCSSTSVLPPLKAASTIILTSLVSCVERLVRVPEM